MDQELIAYLDERFRETSQQITSLREEMDRRFDGVDQRFEQVDQRFERVDQRFEQVDRRFEEVAQRFEQVEDSVAQLATEVRHTQITIEGLRGEIRILAEGAFGLAERQETHESKVDRRVDEVEVLIPPYYQDLNRRVLVLESRADRETRDIIDVIREKYSRPQAS
jgi:hypothetical protein